MVRVRVSKSTIEDVRMTRQQFENLIHQGETLELLNQPLRM